MSLLDNLVAYWSLDDASGTDLHGGNDLTVETDGVPPAVVTGKVGNALRFNSGDDSQYLWADGTLEALQVSDIEFTYTAWFNLDSNDGFTRWIIRRTQAFAFGYESATGTMLIEIYDAAYTVGPASAILTSAVTISFGAWHFAVFWYDPATNTLSLQIDNGAVETLSTAAPFQSDYDFRITNGTWDGLFDEIGFWKRILSPSERTALYNDGSGLAYPLSETPPLELLTNLVAYWKMDEASGDVLDAHGANHLTQYGSVGTLGSAAGIINTARDFAIGGTVDVRRTSGSALSTGDIDFTFSCWVQATAITFSATVLTRATSTTDYTSDINLVNYGSNFSFWVNDYDGPFIDWPDELEIGVWYHLICWHDSINDEIGLVVNNGTPVTESHASGLTEDPTLPFIVGFAGHGGIENRWNGQIDEIGFWKRMLTPEERAALYNDGNGLAYSLFEGEPPPLPDPAIIGVFDVVTVSELSPWPSPLKLNVSDFVRAYESVAYKTGLNLLTGLSAYWPMNEASGSALDVHGGNDLPVYISSPSSALGKIGNARDFEYSNGHYFQKAVSGTALSTGGAFTVSAWVNIEDVSRNEISGIVGKNGAGGNEFQLFLDGGAGPPRRFAFNIGTGGALRKIVTNVTAVVGVWYHLIAWYDTTDTPPRAYISVDNASPFSTTFSGPLTALPADPFFIGGYQPSSSFYMWDGLIDEVGFWKRALSPEERTLLYHNGRGITYPLVVKTQYVDVNDSVPVGETLAGYRYNPQTLVPVRCGEERVSVTDGVELIVTNPYTLVTGIQAYWRLDEASGIALDSVGGSHLDETNTVGTDVGKVNTARDFPGDSDLRRISGDALATGDVDFTFSLWARMTTLVDSVTLLTRKDVLNHDINMMVYNEEFEFWVNNWDGPHADAGFTAEVGIWYHIVFWHDSVGNKIGLAVNDSVPDVVNHSIGLVSQPTIPFILGFGGTDQAGEHWIGQIDEVGFWRRVLTQTERTALYNNGFGVSYPFGLSYVFISISVDDAVTVSGLGGALRAASADLPLGIDTVSEQVSVLESVSVANSGWLKVATLDSVRFADWGTANKNHTLPLCMLMSGGQSNSDPNKSLGGAISSTFFGSQQFSESQIPGVTVLYSAGNAEGFGRIDYYAATRNLWWFDPGSTDISPWDTHLSRDGMYSIEGDNNGSLFVKVVMDELPLVDASSLVQITNVPNQVFDPVTSKQLAEGHTDYRCFYLLNSNAENNHQHIFQLWINSLPSDALVTVGLDAAGKGDGVTTGQAVTISGDTEAPSGVTFLDVTPGVDEVSVGALASGQAIAVWLARTIPPGSDAASVYSNTLKIEAVYQAFRYSWIYPVFQYTLKDHLAQPWVFDYPFQIVAPFELDAPLFTQRARTALDIVCGFGDRVAASVVLDANLLQRVAHGWDFPYLFTSTVRREFVLVGAVRPRAARLFEFVSEIRATQKSRRAWELVCGLFTTAAITTVTQPIITIKGYSFPVEQAEVRLDEGQYAWACTLTLYDPVYYDLFQPGDIFSIDMLGEVYVFLYDGKSFSRNSIVDISASVSGISPSAVLGEPRATNITKTWNTSVLTLDVVREVTEGYPLVWEILNWGLPAFRLAVEDMTPIEIVQLIATAAGGIVQTDPDGTLRVRYLFPIRVPDYPTAVENQFYSDLDHNFTINEEVALPEIVNKIRIMDIAPGAFQDRVEFVQDEDASDRGYLKVFPSPWRETLWVEHTSKPSVSATYVGVVTEKLEPEDVEILDSKSSVSHPIYQLNTLEWLYLDLGGIVFESDKSEFTTTSTTQHESLLRITYTTRYLRFNVVAPGVEKVQFLVKEES